MNDSSINIENNIHAVPVYMNASFLPKLNTENEIVSSCNR